MENKTFNLGSHLPKRDPHLQENCKYIGRDGWLHAGQGKNKAVVFLARGLGALDSAASSFRLLGFIPQSPLLLLHETT